MAIRRRRTINGARPGRGPSGSDGSGIQPRADLTATQTSDNVVAMRRTLLFATIAALSLAACGGSDSKSDGEPDTTEADAEGRCGDPVDRCNTGHLQRIRTSQRSNYLRSFRPNSDRTVIVAGTGNAAADGDTVIVDYVGVRSLRWRGIRQQLRPRRAVPSGPRKRKRNPRLGGGSGRCPNRRTGATRYSVRPGVRRGPSRRSHRGERIAHVCHRRPRRGRQRRTPRTPRPSQACRCRQPRGVSAS